MVHRKRVSCSLHLPTGIEQLSIGAASGTYKYREVSVVQVYGAYSSALQYCPGMTGQDLSHAARLQILLLYKSCLFPFRHSSDYLVFGHLSTSTA